MAIRQRSKRGPERERQKKELVLLQLALVLLSGGTLSYERLTKEFLLERRTAERYLRDLKDAGLPLATRREGRQALFALDDLRSRALKIEAVDIPPAAARPLSLLLVAAALLPSHLGVREAVDSTVRAAMRLRGLRAAGELRRLEDAVRVLENDAKDYEGLGEFFSALVDATLSGQLIEVRYRSPRSERSHLERFYVATIGLYRGGLYALAVPPAKEGSEVTWRAVERITDIPLVVPEQPLLAPRARLAALEEAGRRWGPARPRQSSGEQVITLHFSSAVAPYVLARPWHPRAELEPWPNDEGGGVRMGLRLSGETSMFESWVRSWGAEVQVLRPLDMAERIARSLEEAARGHRAAASRFALDLEG
jgi:predicted DNA-binding transcriptional regulator YafY